ERWVEGRGETADSSRGPRFDRVSQGPPVYVTEEVDRREPVAMPVANRLHVLRHEAGDVIVVNTGRSSQYRPGHRPVVRRVGGGDKEPTVWREMLDERPDRDSGRVEMLDDIRHHDEVESPVELHRLAVGLEDRDAVSRGSRDVLRIDVDSDQFAGHAGEPVM